MTLDQAAQFAAGTFLSGPVGGAGGAVRICEMAVDDCITFDMGGTSTDVALIHQGLMPRISHTNQIDAYPLQVPQLDIHTIGAGGGSIACVQPDGTLEVLTTARVPCPDRRALPARRYGTDDFRCQLRRPVANRSNTFRRVRAFEGIVRKAFCDRG